MYGLVNSAIKEFVIANQGEGIWQQISTEAGLDQSEFAVMQAYPDNITYDLVAAASKVLNLEPETILEAFGEYWPSYAEETAYSRLMSFAGQSFADFLNNLDDMHARIKMSLPELDPPSFEISDSSETGFQLHYYSEREGLAPLVKGILKGLAKNFGVEVEIDLVKSRSQGHDHDEFAVRYQEASAGQAA